MKKKIFSFIIALAIICTGAMYLTACGSTPNGEDVSGKTGTLASVKIIGADGVEITESEDGILSHFLTDVLPGWNTEFVGQTAKCEENGNVSGTCELFATGNPDVTTFDDYITAEKPIKWTYDKNRENTVEIIKAANGVETDEDYEPEVKLVGNLVNGTLTLKMGFADQMGGAPGYEGIVIQFTFTIA